MSKRKARLFLTSVALGVFLLVSPGISSADTYYTVNQGDNLWRISRMYSTSVENIMFLNGMTSNTIHPGQQLLVASGAGTVQAKPPTWTSQVDPVQTASRSSDRVTELIDYSKTFIGVPYVSAGMSPSGFDCSGFTKYVFAHFNINLPRTAAEQYNVSQAVSTGEAKPGDLVAFKTGSYISHVGIYLGGDQFISATSSKGVAIASIYGSYWKERFLGFARVIPS